MKIKVYLLAFLLVSLLLAASSAAAQVAATTITIPGLKKAVTVRRDGRGIPYIEATNDDDLYFAQGFVTAGDRLWQMDLMRRLARGETAEIFGKATLEEDKRWRKYGFSKITEESLRLLAPDVRNALENYAKGVNAYIATLDKDSLPVEFKILQYKPAPWKATDTLCIGKILADALSTTWPSDLLRASLANLPKDKLDVIYHSNSPYDVILFSPDRLAAAEGTEKTERDRKVSDFIKNSVFSVLSVAKKNEELREKSLSRVGLYAEELAASNNWVISGKRTADGKPILANDPHLAPTAPGVWYLVNISSPTQKVAGVSVPGVPGVVLGHNEFIAWGATNVGPDVQDLYVEEFNDKNQYKTPTGWETAVVRREEVKFRNNPLAPQTETEILEVTETRNGVIYVEDGNRRMALKWTGRDPKNQEFEAFIGLNHAKNWTEFQEALKAYGGATQNFVFADTKGNIGWYAAGKIPLRRTGDGSTPYNGATNEGAWTGYIPFAELPHLYNPSEGFIVTANQRAVGYSYKYPQYYRSVAQPFRARRIYDSILSKPKITMDEVSAIQMDVLNIPLSDLTKELLKTGSASAQTLEILKNWDYRMTSDSRAALLANEIYNVLAEKIRQTNAVDKNGKPLNVSAGLVRETVLNWLIREKPAGWRPQQFTSYEELFKACDAEARANLAKRYGTDESKWIWGQVSKARFPHPLAVAPLIGAQFATPDSPLDSSGSTPNVGSSVSMRLVASPGNWDATRHVIPLGQSGNPRSPYFKDQFEFWSKGLNPTFPFNKPAVEAAAKETVVLQPK